MYIMLQVMYIITMWYMYNIIVLFFFFTSMVIISNIPHPPVPFHTHTHTVHTHSIIIDYELFIAMRKS